MKMIEMECKNCGYSMKRIYGEKGIVCEACGSFWSLQEEENDVANSYKTKEDYEKLLEYRIAVKRINKLESIFFEEDKAREENGREELGMGDIISIVMCGLCVIVVIFLLSGGMAFFGGRTSSFLGIFFAFGCCILAIVFFEICWKRNEKFRKKIKGKEKLIEQIAKERLKLADLPKQFRYNDSIQLLMNMFEYRKAESIQEACGLCDSVKLHRLVKNAREQAVVTSEHLYRRLEEYRRENKKENLVPMWISLGAYPAAGIPALVLLYSYWSMDGDTEVKAAVICSLIGVALFFVLPLFLLSKRFVSYLKRSDVDETQ